MSSRDSSASQGTSRSLLERARAKDRDAWNRLVEIYAPLVFHHCRNAQLGDADTADVFQEVFQATFAKLDTFERRASGGTFRGWLSTIARNKVNDHFRRLQREPRGIGGTEIQIRMSQAHAPEKGSSIDVRESAGTDADAIALAESHVLGAALDTIRGQFKERTWRAFLGTVVQGRSPKHVGEELEMSTGAVRVAKSRVLQRLRAALGEL